MAVVNPVGKHPGQLVLQGFARWQANVIADFFDICHGARTGNFNLRLQRYQVHALTQPRGQKGIDQRRHAAHDRASPWP